MSFQLTAGIYSWPKTVLNTFGKRRALSAVNFFMARYLIYGWEYILTTKCQSAHLLHVRTAKATTKRTTKMAIRRRTHSRLTYKPITHTDTHVHTTIIYSWLAGPFLVWECVSVCEGENCFRASRYYLLKYELRVFGNFCEFLLLLSMCN